MNVKSMVKNLTGKAILFLFLFILIYSCSRVQKQPNDPAKETPKALEQNDRDVSSFSFTKRGSYNLVDDLYKGLVDENQPLKEIETLLDGANTKKNELLELYQEFDNKNKDYYSAANAYTSSLSDTLLKARILSIIKASTDKYNGKVNNLEAMIKHIEAKNTSIQDYYTAMKIILTIPLIENFQKTHLPKDSVYRGFYKQQDQILNKINTVSKNQR